MFVVKVLGKLGDALRVCFSLEFETLAFKESLELLVIGDDTVMNNCEFPVRVGSANLMSVVLY